METVPRPGAPLLEALLADLERLDIKLWVEGGRLRFDAPQGALTPELRTRLQANKSAMIAFLANKGAPSPQGELPASEGSAGPRTYPLAFAQRHFGNLQRLNPTHCFYNVPFAFRLSGKLDLSLLRQSFEAIVRRHDFLRTTLREIDGALMQIVAPFDERASVLPLPVVELQHLPEPERDEAVSRTMRDEWRTPFDLARDCALRVRLLRLAGEEHVLLLCLHNVLFEAGALRALLHELGAHYAALLAGEPGSLPPLPMQYADCVRWQQSLLATGMESRLAYWREWFSKGEPPPITLAIAKRTEPPSTFGAGMLWFEFPPELTQRLHLLSQQAGVTLFITLLSAYAVVLHRYSGCSDVVMGTTFANRNHWKLEPLIGSLLNIVALRFDLSGDPDVLTLLRSVRDTVLTAFTQQDVPFASIAPILQPGQPRKTPLFRNVFTFLGELPNDQLRLPGIRVTAMDKVYCDVMFPDLYPAIWEKKTDSGTVLAGCWQYKQELYPEEMARRMLQDFRALLEAMAAHPEGTMNAALSPEPPLLLSQAP